MPLPLPNLDAKRFDDLVAEMRALIPQYAPQWTNHNPSDPGVTLVELLAWVTEATLYRLNQIPDEAYRNFVALLNPDAVGSDWGASVDSLRRRIETFFRERANQIPGPVPDPVLEGFWVFFNWEAAPERLQSVGALMRRVVQFFNEPLPIRWIPPTIYRAFLDFFDREAGNDSKKPLPDRLAQFFREPSNRIPVATYSCFVAFLEQEAKAHRDQPVELLRANVVQFFREPARIPQATHRNFVAFFDQEPVDLLRSRIENFFRDTKNQIPEPALNGFWAFFNWEAADEHMHSVGALKRRVVQFFNKPLPLHWIPQTTYRSFLEFFDREAASGAHDSAEPLPDRLAQFFRAPSNRIPDATYSCFVAFLEQEADSHRDQPVESLRAHVVQFFNEPVRIPQATYRNFVAFLDQELESLKRRAVQFFNEPYRAVTASDFERAAKQAAPDAVARVRVVSDERLGVVTVVVIPFQGSPPSKDFLPLKDLLNTVKRELNRRKLICTQVRVVEPVYTEIALDVTIVCERNAKQEEVSDKAKQIVGAYLHPLTGGPDGRGWPFGRSVTVFDLYKLLEPISGVDRVKKIVMKESGKIQEREVPVKDLPNLISLKITIESL